MLELLASLSRIGVEKGDDDYIVVKKQFLVYQGAGMSLGGILWGTLLLIFNYPSPSVIPFGYTLITCVNFYLLWKYKNFEVARFIQMTISLLLPFFLQWFLGGYNESGGTMIWSLLALVSSATYQEKTGNVVIIVLFAALTVSSLIFDPYFEEHYNMGVSEGVSLVFLVVNILCVSTIVFFLVLYFERENQSNLRKLHKSYTKLINSEKLAALGQISAGVAHEINTPLGAIKSSSEESLQAFQEMLTILPEILAQMNSEEEKDQFLFFITSLNPDFKFLTTKEERVLKKELKAELDELGVDQSRFIAERLVKVGIHHLDDNYKQFCAKPYFPQIVALIYDLLNIQRNNNTIQIAVEKASRIVQALKTYLHSTVSEERESINLEANIDVVLTIYHNRLKQGVSVIKEYEEVPEILGYSDQLNQVWTNLIINAIQAMEGKGELTLGIKQKNDFVQVSIKDNGCGIPEDIQKKIFDPFFTTKISGEGSGLGLDIIKRILEEHGGDIYFETEINKGTTFYIELPVNHIKHE
jgi:signal transduction histidine kinase